MRVLNIIGGLMNFGGVESYILNNIKVLHNENISFGILCQAVGEGRYDEELRGYGVDIYNIPTQDKKALKKFFDANKFDIVHIHSYSCRNYYVAKIAKQSSKKIIYHCHNSNVGNKLANVVGRFFLSRYGVIKCACGQKAAEWAFGRRLLHQVKILNNSIFADQFEYSESLRKSIRTELNITDEFCLMHIGRFSIEKNHKFLLEIMDNIKEKKVILLLVGDGELKGDVEQIAKQKRLLNNVVFLGRRENINELLLAADVLLLPSFNEGFPIVMIESQATNLPIIASEYVSEETKINDNVYFLPLLAEEWIQKLMAINTVRDSKVYTLTEAGYNVVHEAPKLLEFYRNII